MSNSTVLSTFLTLGILKFSGCVTSNNGCLHDTILHTWMVSCRQIVSCLSHSFKQKFCWPLVSATVDVTSGWNYSMSHTLSAVSSWCPSCFVEKHVLRVQHQSQERMVKLIAIDEHVRSRLLPYIEMDFTPKNHQQAHPSTLKESGRQSWLCSQWALSVTLSLAAIQSLLLLAW